MSLRLPGFTLSRVPGRVSVVTDRPGLLHEVDADPIIFKHAISWLVSIETYQLKRRQWIGNWRLYYHDQGSCMYVLGNRVVLGFRGQLIKDLYDELRHSLGRWVFPYAVEASNWVFALLSLNQHTDVDVTLTGHSVGGAIAREIGRVLSLNIVTFNATAPPSSPVISPERSVDYHIVFDMSSSWQSPNTVRIDKGFRPWVPIRVKFPYMWVYHVLYGVKPAHDLFNFAKRLPGNVVTTEFENELVQRWFLGFTISERVCMFTYLVSGAAGGYISIPLIV